MPKRYFKMPKCYECKAKLEWRYRRDKSKSNRPFKTSQIAKCDCQYWMLQKCSHCGAVSFAPMHIDSGAKKLPVTKGKDSLKR